MRDTHAIDHSSIVFWIYFLWCQSGTSSSSAPASPTRTDDDYDAVRIRIGNLTRASDFFAALGAEEPLDPDSINNRSRRPSRQAFTDKAGCEPEMRTINLSNFTNTIEDPDVAVFPECIRAPRCGGCCGPHNLIQCLPSKITLKDIKRAVVRLSGLADSRRKRESTLMETIQIEFHEECSCQCVQKENDCDPDKHDYQPFPSCKCACRDTSGQEDCVNQGSHRVWDSKDCSCRCRHQRHCSTGLRFSHETCRCELE